MPQKRSKAAAVPYVNSKGERSMKKVKVEIHVAGKKPSYATGDDELAYVSSSEESSSDEAASEYQEEEYVERIYAKTNNEHDETILAKENDNQEERTKTKDDDSDDDDDDPRLKRLKELSRSGNFRVQASTSSDQHRQPDQSIATNTVIEDDEDEEEIKARHQLARKLVISEPLGVQAVLSEIASSSKQAHYSDDEENPKESNIETEDLLGDFTITRMRPKELKASAREEAQDKVKKLLSEAQRQADLRADAEKRIEEENKNEIIKERMQGDDFASYQIAAVDTEDEDEDIAYEKWKVRECMRVKRDRLERV